MNVSDIYCLLEHQNDSHIVDHGSQGCNCCRTETPIRMFGQ
jgi:hypothetical protein